MRRDLSTPYTYTEPEQRRDRAESHFCEEIGSSLYVSKVDCPYCEIELPEPEGAADREVEESIEEIEEIEEGDR